MSRLLFFIQCSFLTLNLLGQTARKPFLFHETFKYENAPKKIRIILYEQYFPSTELIDTVITNNSSDFIFASQKVPTNGVMKISYPGVSGFALLRLYYIKSTDRIEINRYADRAIFTGIGSLKYECQDKVYQHLYDSATVNIKSGIPFVLMERHLTAMDSLETVRAAVITSFEKQLGASFSNALRLDNISAKWQLFFYRFSGIFTSATDSCERSSIADFYQQKLRNLVIEDKSCASKNSALYPICLFEQSRFSQLIDNYLCNSHNEKPKFTFNELWRRLSSAKEKAGRQRALLFLATQSNALQGSDSLPHLLASLSHQLTDVNMRKVFSSILQKQEKGMPVRNFDFMDLLGRSTPGRLFKGKTVLVDVWYTGCTGCAQIAPYIKKIADSLKDRDDIIVVSVSADSDRIKWLKSVNAEIYGSTRELNLYAGPKGFEHPFFKFYDVSSFPRLMIFDKNGNIFQSATLHPRNDKAAEQLVSLLSSAAKKPEQGQ